MIAAGSLESWELAERALHLLFAGFLTLWTIALGASIGSFLNVIIYRLPRGMSLIHPKSRCPVCGTPIRPIDNLPLVGWIRLAGRCRECRAPISARYPIVEGLVAILIFLLAWCEVYSGGINLPDTGTDRLVFNPLLWRFDPTEIIRALYHAVAIALAVAVGYIAWDRFPPPRRLVAATLAVGIALPLFLPAVWPVAGHFPRWLPALPIYPPWGVLIDPHSLVTAAAGIAGGLLAGLLTGLAARTRYDFLGVLFLAVLAGLYLGWTALLTDAPLAAGLALLAATVSRAIGFPIPATTAAAAAFVVQIFAWRPLAKLVDALASMTGDGLLPLLPAAGLLTLILAAAARGMVSTFRAVSVTNAGASLHEHAATRDSQ